MNPTSISVKKSYTKVKVILHILLEYAKKFCTQLILQVNKVIHAWCLSKRAFDGFQEMFFHKMASNLF